MPSDVACTRRPNTVADVMPRRALTTCAMSAPSSIAFVPASPNVLRRWAGDIASKTSFGSVGVGRWSEVTGSIEHLHFGCRWNARDTDDSTPARMTHREHAPPSTTRT